MSARSQHRQRRVACRLAEALLPQAVPAAAVESLESRLLMDAGDPTTLAGGVLWVHGTDGNDAIVIEDIGWGQTAVTVNNTTQLILSRLDNSCKAIVIGSNRQIDNAYLNRYNNGLTTLLRETLKSREDISMFAIELEQSVRGRFANFAESVFEKVS